RPPRVCPRWERGSRRARLAMGERGDSRSPRRLPGMVFWLASWAVCAAVWMLLVDTPYPPELAAGAVVAALAATVVELVRRQRVAMVRIRPRWLRRAWRPVVRGPLDLVVRTRTAVVQLVRPRARHGRCVAVPFAAQ